MNAQSRIDEIKNHGYDLDFGDVFNKSFDNFKKIALQAGIALLLFGMAIAVIFIVFGVAFFGLTSLTQQMTDFNNGNISSLTIIIYVIVTTLFAGLAAPFNAGLIKMAYNAARNLDFSMGTAFEYYSSVYFKELFFSAAIIGFFSFGISTVLKSAGFNIVGLFLTYVIAFFTFLTIPLIIFGNLKAIAAIKGSMIIVSKQLFILLGLLIVGLIVVCLGIVAFCIGIVFTIPLLFSLYYCIYDEIVGTEEKSEIDQIGSTAE